MARARMRSVIAAVVAVVLGLTLGGPAAAATTDGVDPLADRSWVVSLVSSGTPSVRRAAEAALLGSDADLQEFVESGFDEALAADYRAAAQVLGSTDGPALRSAATKALAGPPEALRTFVDGGFRTAWAADEELRVVRAMDSAGAKTREVAEKALEGDVEEWSHFLSSGLAQARFVDEEMAATRMLDGGANNSAPASSSPSALGLAAQAALDGSPEELHEFLTHGQHVARARDAEMATVAGLTEQAKVAGEATATHAADATSASARAVAAAQRAKEAAQEALAQTEAAGGAAQGASAAAGRAADAAAAAEGAAAEASAASSAALRAAQTAADGARRATAAASLTARAAAAAQSAAAAARADAGKAAEARAAAQAARDAAAQAAVLDEVRRQRDAALAQARTAAGAAAGASVNADAAATAADTASRQAGVSAAQAKRTRAAAASAKNQAAVAASAAARSLKFAEDAAAASDEAFSFASQAARYATAAAAAADEAAAQAGIAGAAAAESAAHAAEATKASELAVAAAEQAAKVEQLARRADSARLEEATDQGIAAAQEALAAEKASTGAGGEAAGWDRELRWDTEEEDRVPPATRELLDAAGADGASDRVVVDKGRRAALALMSTGGEWTKAAAVEALAGDETVLRSWLETGRALAAGQDNRARLWHLVDTLPDGQERTAARTALDGDDAAVATFLRTRAYPRKALDDQVALARILESNPGPALYEATQRALDGTAHDAHEFLRTGQYVARTADQEVEIARVMQAGGAEVKAAGQVALEGPASYKSYFLAVGQYQAAQRDVEQAAHVQAVKGLIAQAQQYAQTALADAARARRVAAEAQGAAAEAAAAANQAAAAASRAAGYADEAARSAAAAKSSADQAAASAQAALVAADTAHAAARDAAGSATTAAAAAQRASGDAAEAQWAKQDARASAKAAGMDAVAAEAAAQQAVVTYSSRLEEWQQASRSSAPGTGSDGASAAVDTHRYWNCLTSVDTALGSPDVCINGFKAFGEVMLNPAKCATPLSRDSLGCSMLSEFKRFVGGNADLMWDVAQLALGLCGLIPAVGEVCDALDGAVSAARGDWAGAGLSLLAMAPGVGVLAGSAKVARLTDRLREYVDTILDGLTAGRRANVDEIPTGRACRTARSFGAETKVRLADGSHRRISEIRVGDEVLASDPVSGVRGGRRVTHVWVHQDDLYDLEVDGEVVVTTEDHPFWSVTDQKWEDTSDLHEGELLLGADGRESVVTRSVDFGSRRVGTAFNLAVEGLHTYHVGLFAVLVHNSDGIDLSDATEWPAGDFPAGGARSAAGPPGGILFRARNGSITNYAVYDENGTILYRVDLTGGTHRGVPTPHVQEYRHDERPDGKVFPKPTGIAKPAGPDDLPQGWCEL
ncbi:polymorphic toxin-type HINT domain-containing protein [Cellulomonas dongxiuzhuiae]|uniref:Hint domain-containing protein n=1 Tax=Cellulomonas dongxiuzhuiae TaxID=2819979 RepID=A0ABX8GMP9_9CELL|nr:polymorphic toxin type 24 domain-containing protein [Cellulomonas dongxiuzhuiae]MBO3095875.1 hypothetical protein [Cellulomonas dongxiuzhuiae]QWC17177.1 hypothetical protein KKR89_06150 [Cellulomonas dongxiuzhuiae]